MANHADSTSISNPLPSRRRTLLSGAAAIIMGSGITAGAAASVADFVPENPDAELMAACAQFDRLERDYQALCSREDWAREEVSLDSLHERQKPLLDKICSLPCTTSMGMAAIAASLALWDGELFIGEDDREACANDRLMAALLRSVLAGRA